LTTEGQRLLDAALESPEAAGRHLAAKGGDLMLSQIWVRRFVLLSFLLAVAAAGAESVIGP
jgi:hypothetical protein